MRALLLELVEESFVLIENARSSTAREATFARTDLMMKVAIGMRRTGKSFLLYQQVLALLAQGISSEQILLLNFEDERLRPMDAKTAGKLLYTFDALYPDNHHRRCYFFLDEIHNVTDWFLVVRRFFDTKNVQLYLTGSSSKLLSTEIHTSLRGRSLATEVWPYSFSEYCATHNIAKPPAKSFGKITLDALQKHLREYLFLGGFPAVQLMSQGEWRETLQGYAETVMMRDVIERYKIENIVFFRYLMNTILKNAATTFSVNKFYNDAKSLGYKIGKDTIHLYLQYLEEAFLCFLVPIYSKSERATHNRSKKIYAIDTGLIHAVSLHSNDLYGKLFENLIYLDLRRQQKKVYFYKTKEGFEIDFITVDQEGRRACIQVCWDMSDEETVARETRALSAAKKELGISGVIITPSTYFNAHFY